MRNGKTPIHIQRWAPADFQNDPFVRSLLLSHDLKTYTFYRQFLDASFIEGGSLPKDPLFLAAACLLPRKMVVTALEVCVKAGKIVVRGSRVLHRRVVREVAEELRFRDEQAEHGKRGGRPRLPKGYPLGEPLATYTPPAPAPAPVPAPAPTPAPSATVLDPDARKAFAREVWEAWCQKRGSGTSGALRQMSPREWDLLARWMDAGTPLRIVLRGISDCSAGKITDKTPLSYAGPAVDEAVKSWTQGQTA
jgi:hypothetical protein